MNPASTIPINLGAAADLIARNLPTPELVAAREASSAPLAAQDTVTISFANDIGANSAEQGDNERSDGAPGGNAERPESAGSSSGIQELTPDEKREVAELQARDADVRAHERAHLSAAGQYARGGASFDYVTGPDGQRYAVSGEVPIDSAPIKDDPEATIRKAQQVRAAALAPAQPSSQDQRVAAQATQMEMEARSEMARERYAEQQAFGASGMAASQDEFGRAPILNQFI